MLKWYDQNKMKNRSRFDLDSAFSDLFGGYAHNNNYLTWTVTTTGEPAFAVGEQRNHKSTWTDTGALLELDLPGVKAGDVDVTVVDHQLTVKHARHGVQFEHKFELSSHIEPEPTKATLADGVLTLEFKKTNVEAKKLHKVKIETK